MSPKLSSFVKKRVTQLNLMFILHSSDIDGSSRSFLDMIDGMKKDKIVVHVIIPKKGKVERELRERNIVYEIVPFSWAVIQKGNKILEKTFYGTYIKLCYYIYIWKIDLIHTNSSTIDIGAVISIITRKPHVWHYREFLESGMGYEYKNKKRQIYLMKHSSRILTTSKSLAIEIHKKYKLQNIKILNDGISMSYSGKSKEILDGKDIHLLIVGTICENKGQIYAVKAVEYIKSIGIENVKLRIVGNGEIRYKSYLKEYIACHNLLDKIEICNFNPNIVDEYNKADITLICSNSEGFGRTTIESMLMGLVVIGADKRATNELIQDGVSGLLYPRNDYVKLGLIIQKIMDDKKWAKMIAQQGRAYAEKNCSAEKCGNCLLRIYKSIVEESR